MVPQPRSERKQLATYGGATPTNCRRPHIMTRVMRTSVLETLQSTSACKCHAPHPQTKTSEVSARNFFRRTRMPIMLVHTWPFTAQNLFHAMAARWVTAAAGSPPKGTLCSDRAPVCALQSPLRPRADCSTARARLAGTRDRPLQTPCTSSFQREMRPQMRSRLWQQLRSRSGRLTEIAPHASVAIALTQGLSRLPNDRSRGRSQATSLMEFNSIAAATGITLPWAWRGIARCPSIPAAEPSAQAATWANMEVKSRSGTTPPPKTFRGNRQKNVSIGPWPMLGSASDPSLTRFRSAERLIYAMWHHASPPIGLKQARRGSKATIALDPQ